MKQFNHQRLPEKGCVLFFSPFQMYPTEAGNRKILKPYGWTHPFVGNDRFWKDDICIYIYM